MMVATLLFKTCLPAAATSPQCLQLTIPASFWSYRYCHLSAAFQVATNAPQSKILLGRYSDDPELYADGDACPGGQARSVQVKFSCCRGGDKLTSVTEPAPCRYVFTVCGEAPCGPASTTLVAPITASQRLQLMDEVKRVFYHAYDSYMAHAFPMDELAPLSCKGIQSALTAGSMLTLVDALDTLAVFGNHTEFHRAVNLILSREDDLFDVDNTVSVFETTIRVLGGLLSAHLFLIDPELGLGTPAYNGGLLRLAVNLADRLMPAFKTSTHIPIGTVHLKSGVPRGETTEACTAAAGSLSIEFGVLSVLTKNESYGAAARLALKALHDHRSHLDLLGRHIDVESGRWTETIAGIGSNVDSVYEYYFKHYVLFGDDETLDWFNTLYRGAIRHLRLRDGGRRYYHDSDMKGGNVLRRQFGALQAFWPGLQSLTGDLPAATRTLNGFMSIWETCAFVPEDFDLQQWTPLKGGSHAAYLLRPELAESVYYSHLATGDDSWLLAGREILSSITRFTRVPCGHAAVQNVETKALMDVMPSFFLSETVKYLYLLFDKDNFLNTGNWIFSTEAHPFRVTAQMQAAGFVPPASSATARSRPALPAFDSDMVELLRGVPSLQPDAVCGECPAPPPSEGHLLDRLESYYLSLPEHARPQDMRPSGDAPAAAVTSQSIFNTLASLLQGPQATALPKDTVEGAIPGVGRFQISASAHGFRAANVDLGQELQVFSLDMHTVSVVSNYRFAQPALYVNLARPGYGASCRGTLYVRDACINLAARAYSALAFVAPRTSLGAPLRTFACSPSEWSSGVAPILAALSLAGPDNDEACDGPLATAQPGAWVLVRRGKCSFHDKAVAVASAGGVGAVVALVDASALFVLAGNGEQSLGNIPSFMVPKLVGDALALAYARGASPTLVMGMVRDPSLFVSADRSLVVHAFPGWKATVVPTADGKFHLQVTVDPA